MNWLDRAIASVAPEAGLRRAQARAALELTMRYEAGSRSGRAAKWRAPMSDADTASSSRGRISGVSRDLVRNAPYAARVAQVMVSNVVGDGIIPKVRGRNARQADKAREIVKEHLDTTAIDLHGRSNLYGLQQLALRAVTIDGEVLVRRVPMRDRSLPLPFQIELLEVDYLDSTKDTMAVGGRGIIDGGIEFNADGKRVAYWLFDEHPGTSRRVAGAYNSRRIPAADVIHIYRQDRPGQQRGVSLLAPVVVMMQDFADHQDAKLMQQKIAACFAAFRTGIAPESQSDDDAREFMSALTPGRIENLQPGEDVKFAQPPTVQGYDEFTKTVLRAIAAGVGITYEALTGDLSGVNFSSGRMGRMEMDRMVSSLQWLLMVPQFLQPLAGWVNDGLVLGRGVSPVVIDWVPPKRFIVDPNREITAMVAAMEAGLTSRQHNIRELGYDPEDVRAEQVEDKAADERDKLTYKGGPVQPKPETVPPAQVTP